MSEISATMAIAIREAQIAAEKESELDERLRAAMRVTLHHYMLPGNEDEQFRAAIGGVLMALDEGDPDYERTHEALDRLKKFSAWLGAATQGLSVDVPEVKEREDLPKLMPLWREIVAEERR